MKRNILLTIEYDGTNFCGWQRQPDKRTVQGEIERVLSIMCREPIQINGTSRTDAGVHGLDQKATFTCGPGIPTDKMPYVMNNLLAGGMNKIGKVGDVRIVSAEEVPAEFHARYDAKGKRYIYRILNSSKADIFGRNYHYQVLKKLDLNKMRQAAKYIVGTHDFKCFQAAGSEEKATTVRTVFDLTLEDKGEEIILEIKGDGFLYNMVRIITGTLVDVGLGKIEAEELQEIIESKDRQRAGHTAPPQGLYLAEVFY